MKYINKVLFFVFVILNFNNFLNTLGIDKIYYLIYVLTLDSNINNNTTTFKIFIENIPARY